MSWHWFRRQASFGRTSLNFEGRQLLIIRCSLALILFWFSRVGTASDFDFPGKPGSPALIFSFSQGFANGPVETANTAQVSAMVKNLRALNSRYPVFVILDIWKSNQKTALATLDILKKYDIPFILDVYASDVMTNAQKKDVFDVRHGLPLSLGDLKIIKAKYGKQFAGLRIFEVFGMNFTVAACKSGAQWCKYFSNKLPDDDFFQPIILRRLVRFASQNNFFILFSDTYWSFSHPDAPKSAHQVRNEEVLFDLLAKFPKRVIIMYANNEAQGLSRAQLGHWQNALNVFTRKGAIGLGLSDQSWICSNDTGIGEADCPVSTLLNWSRDALNSGVLAIEFEPYWYWWNLPRGSPNSLKAVQTGAEPLQTLRALAAQLGVPSL